MAAVNRMVSVHAAAARPRGGGGGAAAQRAAQLAADRAAFWCLAENMVEQLPGFGFRADGSQQDDDLIGLAYAQLLWASATMRAPFPPQLQAAWDARMWLSYTASEPQAAGLAIWAYATLQQRHGLRPSSRALEVMQSDLQWVLHDGSPATRAHALWGWVQLGQPLSEDLRWAASAGLHRAACRWQEPQEAAMSLWCHGALGQLCGDQRHSRLARSWPSEALREQLVEALQRGGPRQVSDILWGWRAVERAFGPPAEASSAAIVRTAPRMTPQQVCNTLSAYASGMWGPPGSQAMAALAEQLPRVLRHGNPHHVAASLQWWGRLNNTATPLPAEAGAAADAAIQRTAARMQPMHVAYVLTAYSTSFNWPPLSSEAVAALRQALLSALGSSDGVAVAWSLAGWAWRNLPVDAELRAAADAAVLRLAPAMAVAELWRASTAHKRGNWQLSAEALAALAARKEQLDKESKERLKHTPGVVVFDE